MFLEFQRLIFYHVTDDQIHPRFNKKQLLCFQMNISWWYLPSRRNTYSDKFLM